MMHLWNIVRFLLTRGGDSTPTTPIDQSRTTTRSSSTPAERPEALVTKETGRTPGTMRSSQEKTLVAIPPVEMTNLAASEAMSEFLDKVIRWDASPQDIKQVLTAAFNANDYRDCIANLRERNIEPLSYINNLDKIIGALGDDPRLQKRCIRALKMACGVYGIVPDSLKIPFTATKLNDRRPYGGGISFSVWRINDEKTPARVFAVKQLWVYMVDPIDRIKKEYCKHAIVWKWANHPNILPMEGVAPALFDYSMVSVWMENGKISDYLVKHPDVNRLEMLVGVARGLSYLHQNNIIHGDLKISSILIDEKGCPRVTDFGLFALTMYAEPIYAAVRPESPTNTNRYRAPELQGVENDMRGLRETMTKQADIYSLSMIIVELATGKIPFPDHTMFTLSMAIMKGKRPSKPDHFDAPGITPGVWKIAKKCWRQNPEERPEANVVLQDLENLLQPNPCTRDACACPEWELVNRGPE